MFREVLYKKLSNNTLYLDDFDQRDTFTNNIIPKLIEENVIGQGAVGKVYLIDDYVVKQTQPCMNKKKALYKYCEDFMQLGDNKIKVIPGGNKKYRYLMPNLLSEITVGTIINNIGFTKTITSMEKLTPLNDSIKTKQHLYCMLFQVAHTLLNTQQQYKFTHYDLHTENLLKDDWPENIDIITYSLGNYKINITKKNCPFIIKLADFGLARFETDKVIVSASVDAYPMSNYGEFNPSYDFACLLGSILIDNKYRVAFEPLFKDKVLYKEMLELMLWYNNDPFVIPGNASLIDMRNILGKQYYKSIGKGQNVFSFRPMQSGTFIPYTNTKSLYDVVYYLSTKIQKTSQGRTLFVPDLSPYRRNTKIELFNPILKIKEQPIANKSMYVEKSMIINKHIKVTKYHILYNKPPNPKNFTIETKQLDKCPIQKHYFTIIHVKAAHEWVFKFDCCKLDAVNYMINYKKNGFVINGGFYNVKKDYLPIGPYKDGFSIVNDHPINNMYKDVYGYIILKNNKLSITQTYNDKDQLCSSGPMLIYNGKIVYHADENRFFCADKRHNEDLMIEQDDDRITLKGYYTYNNCDKKFVKDEKEYKRCDKINPGELQHGNNPNPRSALCILGNGDYVFVCFEGRSNKGVGIDLEALSRTLLLTYPNIVHAINLDGGRSSVLAWKMNNVVYCSNPDRFYYYPHGNIIGLFEN
jgi:exopolysaccharide biosynthesis protein